MARSSVSATAELSEDAVERAAVREIHAPVEAPQIAVAVIVENGGHGGATAAPIARAVMDSWLLDVRVPESTGMPAGSGG